IAEWESQQFWSRYASAAWLSFRYYFQALRHRADGGDDSDWLAGITAGLAAEEALLWLTSALTLTCALAVQPEVPAWTTREKVRAVTDGLLDAIARTVQSEPVQGVRVFPHVMFLASATTTTTTSSS